MAFILHPDFELYKRKDAGFQRRKQVLTSLFLSSSAGIGVHNVTVSQWETGAYLPQTVKLKKLVKALHVSEADLLNDSSSNNTGWVLHIKVANSFSQEVIDLTKKLLP